MESDTSVNDTSVNDTYVIVAVASGWDNYLVKASTKEEALEKLDRYEHEHYLGITYNDTLSPVLEVYEPIEGRAEALRYAHDELVATWGGPDVPEEDDEEEEEEEEEEER